MSWPAPCLRCRRAARRVPHVCNAVMDVGLLSWLPPHHKANIPTNTKHTPVLQSALVHIMSECRMDRTQAFSLSLSLYNTRIRIFTPAVLPSVSKGQRALKKKEEKCPDNLYTFVLKFLILIKARMNKTSGVCKCILSKEVCGATWPGLSLGGMS